MKNFMKLVVTLMSFVMLCAAQTARVVPLADDDAVKLSEAYKKFYAAQKDYDELRKKLAEKYLVVPQGDADEGYYSANTFNMTVETTNVLDLNCSSALGCSSSSASSSTGKSTKPTLTFKARYWRAGFGCGDYEFSTDFRFIVPKPTPGTTLRVGPYSCFYNNIGEQVCWPEVQR